MGRYAHATHQLIMCGIAGILNIKGGADNSNIIHAMTEQLSHRGPDDEGFFRSQDISLGHKRLSVIDLSKSGHQPMKSNDGKLIIIHNGEIYNFKEIRRKILDYDFISDSDTEVVLAAYQKWGKDCLQYFNGMYSFAIWDTQKAELFIARDRLGKKPLYYFKQDNCFVFSSEIRSLLASNLIPKKINRSGLIDFLRYQTVHAPETILQDIYVLMPGNYMVVSKEKFEINTYWNLRHNISSSSQGKSYDEICKDIYALLFVSVERRLISDVPLGVFLSGGIDSSAIVGLLSRTNSPRTKTFSVVFDEKKFNEAKYSRIVAEKFKTEHHEIKLKGQNILEQILESLHSFDHPSGDGINTYLISKAVKQAGVTVALSGVGGDELFAGYPVFKRNILRSKLQWIWLLPEFVRKNLSNLLKQVIPGIHSEKIAQILSLKKGDFNSIYPISRQLFSDFEINDLMSSPNLNSNAISNILIHLNLQTLISKLLPVSLVEISTYLQNVLLRDTDQMSMANALETRAPFLDVELVQYVLGVSDEFKYPSFPKKLLVDSLGDLLPKEIVHRPKAGFTFPWETWLKNDLKIFCDEKLNSLACRNFFNPRAIENSWLEFLKGNKKIAWAKIWNLVVLENWLTENNISE